jgi:hypothetical protein
MREVVAVLKYMYECVSGEQNSWTIWKNSLFCISENRSYESLKELGGLIL